MQLPDSRDGNLGSKVGLEAGEYRELLYNNKGVLLGGVRGELADLPHQVSCTQDDQLRIPQAHGLHPGLEC